MSLTKSAIVRESFYFDIDNKYVIRDTLIDNSRGLEPYCFSERIFSQHLIEPTRNILLRNMEKITTFKGQEVEPK